MCTDAKFDAMREIRGLEDRTVRMKGEVYHQARVAAVISQQSMGQWIEEAISERFRREAAPILLGSEGQGYPLPEPPSVVDDRTQVSEAMPASD